MQIGPHIRPNSVILRLAMVIMGVFALCSHGIPPLPGTWAEEVSFQLTGGGSYCQGQSGLSLTLAGSETGTQYQLLRNGIAKGNPVAGTGEPLTWTDQTEGAYQVLAYVEEPGSGELMEGKVVIVEEPEPVIAMGYAYHKTLTIPAASVQGSENLTGFPLYVEIENDTDLRSVTYGGHVLSEEGYDIAFTDSGFEPLLFELRDYDPETGSLSAWVLIPDLPHDTQTEIQLLFGKSGIVGDLSSSELWGSEYLQVMHLDSDLSDATRYGNFGLDSGTIETNAVLGMGRQFDGSDDMIIVGQDTSLQKVNEQGTLSLWIRWADASDGDHQIVFTTENRFDGDGFEWASQGNGNHFFYPSGHHVDNYNMVSNPFTDGTWHYLALTLEYASQDVSFFVDGLPIGLLIENTPVYWTQMANLDAWLWGGNPDRSSRYLLGAMDEIRVQSEIRSEGWLRTEYLNQSDPGGFYTLGGKNSLDLFAPVCAKEPPYTLPDIKPAGGVYSGPGVQGSTFDPSSAGVGFHEIVYTYTGPSGCMAQASDTLQVLATPSPQIVGNDSLCPGTTGEIYFTDSVSGHTYLWTLDATGANIVSGQGTHRIAVNWGNSPGNLSVRESDPISGCDSTTALFPVFVGDAEGPAMGCLEDLTIELDTSCTFALPDYRSLLNPMDECDASILVEQTPPAGTVLAGSGTQQEITIRAEDQSENETLCSFTITLMDVAAPFAESLSDTTILIPEGIYESEVSPTPPQFSDNCGILSITNDFNGGGGDASGVYPLGTTVVQYTVSDVNGNVSTFEQRVSLEYENAPDFGLIIPEAISPNNDGFNDQFRILGLEAYPANRLDIFNVHGIRVYSQESYDHSWEGTSMNGNEKPLPSGTYYYVLYLEHEDAILKGFIYLRRE